MDGRTPQSMKGGTDDYFIGSCYYAMSVKMTADAARVLDNTEDAAYYDGLYRHIYQAVLKEYYTESGRLGIDTQTGYLVALYSGIYQDKGRVINGLKERLYKDCYNMKGGFVARPLCARSWRIITWRKRRFTSCCRSASRAGCTASIWAQQQSGNGGISVQKCSRDPCAGAGF